MTLSGTVALHVSCLRLLPNKHMVRRIMKFAQRQSFTLTTNESKQNRICHQKNSIPQGLVLAFPFSTSFYLNLYLASMICRKFTYAGGLALLHSSGKWKTFEKTLTNKLLMYLQNWRLKLSHTKTMTASFYLNNKATKVS